MNHSSLNNDEPIDATPISFYVPNDYYIDYDDAVDNPTNMNESPSATQNSTSKIGRCPKPPPEWIKNWKVELRKRRNGEKVDKIYHHKEKGFQCRSLVEVERYEKEGIRPQRRKPKTRDKEESSNKTQNETKEMILASEKNKEAETEEMLVAQRKGEAEDTSDSRC